MYHFQNHNSSHFMKMKNTKLNILVLVVSTILILLFTEILVRTFFPQSTLKNYKSIDAPVFDNSDYLPFTFKPNAEGRQISPYNEFDVYVKTNSIGTRGHEPYLKTNNIRRIVFVGDSFTYGYGVSDEDSYPRKVESKLNENNFYYDVINAGYASGLSPDSYYLYLKRNLDSLDVDVVIMGFYTGNDINDLSKNNWINVDHEGFPERITSTTYFISEEGRRQKLYTGLFKNKLVYNTHLFLYSSSHLYALIGSAIWNSKNRVNPLYSNNWDNQTIKNWDKMQGLLKETNHMLKRKKIPFLIVIINSRVQTVDEIWEQYSSKYRKYDLDRQRLNEELIKFCKKEKIYCLDLFDAFHSQNDQEVFYFKVDGHWNELGHELASYMIVDYFSENFIN